MDKLVYDNYEYCLAARDQINQNMGYDGVNNNFDDPTEINNIEHPLYQKWYIAIPEGDPEHHALWMTGIVEKDEEHPEGYVIHEWESDWIVAPSFP
jgi:hypothetical protein